MFKFGDIVYIKVNGVCGFVEEVIAEDGTHSMVTVMIPRKEPIPDEPYSTAFYFTPEELETAEERVARELNLQIHEFEIKEEWQSRRRKLIEKKNESDIWDGLNDIIGGKIQ